MSKTTVGITFRETMSDPFALGETDPEAGAPVIGAGVLRLGLTDLMKLTSTLRVINAEHPADQVRALATFGRFFMGSLWDTYGPKMHF